MPTSTSKNKKTTASRTDKAIGSGPLVSPSDSEMLDWLDRQGAHYGWAVQTPSDYPNVRDAVFVCRNTTSGHRSIREAIAARMANNLDQTRGGQRSA